MTIDTMLKLCHACNIVHFPQGIEVVRDGGGFIARIVKKHVGSENYTPQNSTNKTAQGALDDLANYITVQARDYAKRKQRDASEAADTVTSLLGDAKGGG
ncbi:MAG: hypothetical protein EBR82_26395 [Caulobacteraceae bacterium]|nr:hypothetical protein [Caulobacteraceae bacterium]